MQKVFIIVLKWIGFIELCKITVIYSKVISIKSSIFAIEIKQSNALCFISLRLKALLHIKTGLIIH